MGADAAQSDVRAAGKVALFAGKWLSLTKEGASRHTTLNVEEIRKDLPKLLVQCDKLRSRLVLEVRMVKMVIGLPLFLLYTGLFMVALEKASPTEMFSTIHAEVLNHYNITSTALATVRTKDDVYGLILWFELANRKLQPTSSEYWCETRYTTWVDSGEIPQATCNSPRYYALGITNDEMSSWTCRKDPASCAEGRSSRRLSELRESVGYKHFQKKAAAEARRRQKEEQEGRRSRRLGETEPTEKKKAAAQCEDATAVIDDWNADLDDSDKFTCASSWICNEMTGIQVCPKSCGYCTPFEYTRVKKFDKQLVTLLPTVVAQTRFDTEECKGYAKTLVDLPPLEGLSLMPAIDGKRSDSLFSCVGRGKEKKAEFGFEVKCPAAKSAQTERLCDAQGYIKNSPAYKYNRETVYAKFMEYPHKQVEAMQMMGWVDGMTNAVTMSTAIFHPTASIYTLLTVTVELDFAGGISSSVNLISYYDMNDKTRLSFYLTMTMVILIAILSTLWACYAHATILKFHAKHALEMYGTFSRLLMITAALTFVIYFVRTAPMGDLYGELISALQTQTSPDTETETSNPMVQSYLDIMSKVYGKFEGTQFLRTFAYLVMYVQFVQLVFHLAAHPKMAALSSTLYQAMPDLLHFLPMFLMVFLLLAFMAHWVLGDSISTFGTYDAMVAAQFRMLYGEFIYVAEAEGLDSTRRALFWLFASTFMLVAFFTLLNFFLAIVVDAFTKVKERNDEAGGGEDFLSDVLDVPRNIVMRMRFGWPRSSDILAAIDQCEDDFRELQEDEKCLFTKLEGEHTHCNLLFPATEAADFFGFTDKDSYSEFLRYYYRKMPSILSFRGSRSAEANSSGGGGGGSATCVETRLQELQKLKDKELVSTEEFERLKGQLLQKLVNGEIGASTTGGVTDKRLSMTKEPTTGPIVVNPNRLTSRTPSELAMEKE
eukprot:TRINITY_DN32865_c0_g2_i3.p1 TRINITY_DN32865_c0_g2~~TRINITY_DN32865_c0_g2_i3.p1  ORF type:complete len:941 (-),score=275.36 TRINITY_DN32865_c0_g2_i3:285-3107(-)